MSGRILREVIQKSAEKLKAEGIASPLLEAILLTAHALKITREKVIMMLEETISFEKQFSIEKLIERRLNSEPVAYIRGIKEFWSFEFEVNRTVMIPRPETELLVERCLKHLNHNIKKPTIADIGTGCGAIACALAKEITQSTVFATDISKDALRTAKSNIEKFALSDSILLVAGDLLCPFKPEGIFHCICANLPYIPKNAWQFLPEGIKNYEPPIALIGGEDGLGLIKRVATTAHLYLANEGMLALEVSDEQVKEVESILLATGQYKKTGFDIDHAGFKRVVWAIRK